MEIVPNIATAFLIPSVHRWHLLNKWMNGLTAEWMDVEERTRGGECAIVLSESSTKSIDYVSKNDLNWMQAIWRRLDKQTCVARRLQSGTTSESSATRPVRWIVTFHSFNFTLNASTVIYTFVNGEAKKRKKEKKKKRGRFIGAAAVQWARFCYCYCWCVPLKWGLFRSYSSS